MSTWRSPVLTTAGKRLLSKLMSGNTLSIVMAESGAGYVEPTELEHQSSVTDPKQQLNVEVLSYPETSRCAVICSLINTRLARRYMARQIGLFATDPDDGVVLFCILQAEDGDGTEILSEAESPGYSADWTFNFDFSQVDGINVVVDPSNMVTHTWLAEYIDTALAATYAEIDAAMDIDAAEGGSGGNTNAVVADSILILP